MSSVFTACKKDDEVTPEIIGYEVSGSGNWDGTYIEDVTYTKGTKYVCREHENYVLMDRTIDGEELWILLIDNNVYYYKTPKTGDYPPESGWTCGIGVDKPKFKLTPVYK